MQLAYKISPVGRDDNRYINLNVDVNTFVKNQLC